MAGEIVHLIYSRHPDRPDLDRVALPSRAKAVEVAQRGAALHGRAVAWEAVKLWDSEEPEAPGPVDYQERCKAYEKALATLYEAIGPLATNSDGRRDSWERTLRFLHGVVDNLTPEEVDGVREALGLDSVAWIVETTLASETSREPQRDPKDWKPTRAEDLEHDDPLLWATSCEVARMALARSRGEA